MDCAATKISAHPLYLPRVRHGAVLRRAFADGSYLTPMRCRTTKDTVLPLSEPICARDGTLLHEVAVPRGTTALISVRACNRNKALWGEDAEEWKPERWLQPLRLELEKATVPGVYSNLYASPHFMLAYGLLTGCVRHRMTFMGGSRSCM